MDNFISSFLLFVIACIGVCALAASLPFVLWYYFRAKELAPLLTKKAALEEILEKLAKDIEIARDELEKFAEDKVAAREFIKEGELAKKWLEESQAKCEDLRLQLIRAKEEYEAAKTQLEDVSEKVSDKRNELTDLNSKILTGDERLASMENKYHEIVSQLEGKEHDLKESLAKLSADKSIFQAERDALYRQVEEFKKNCDDLKAQVAKLDNEIKIKSDSLKSLVDTKTKEMDEELARKRKAFEDEIAQRRLSLEKELQNRRDRFSQDLESQTKEIAALRAKQITEVGEEIKQLQARRDAMLKDLAEFEVHRQKNHELKSENQKLGEELDDLRAKVESAKIQIAEAEAIKVNEANMWKDLERNLEGVMVEEPISSKPKVDAESALETFKRNLDDSGYAFSERTIKAFHTGLLCGDVSPLVVLSGISGTGKSLLPQLYAKAFGMNFLPVAVQPRWDGPQDVFGFYNHMERRFKATELSRLLWQFDRFNNPEAKKAYPDADLAQCPMNVVLLDEMNLARVEYYFSELLSKLEIRNQVIDPTNSDQRRAAEIELEYGASSVSEADVARSMARRIYVDRNILFVGTMNEDESTQSLSSKVIDRSNVLRFGTPDSLKREVKKELFDQRCDNFISYATWRKWSKPVGGKLSRIDDYIKSLKDALKIVDRGFGHRTETAIKRYVDLYPGSKEDAFADQIEMKVLSKLNGVESDLVSARILGRISEVLSDIHDTEVTNALQESLSGDSSFFTWKGVHR